MILWQAIQGFLGAGMIPTVFATHYTHLSPAARCHWSRRSLVWSRRWLQRLVQLSAASLPDAMSWHWLFFINVLPGIGITIGVLALVDLCSQNFALLEQFDW